MEHSKDIKIVILPYVKDLEKEKALLIKKEGLNFPQDKFGPSDPSFFHAATRIAIEKLLSSQANIISIIELEKRSWTDEKYQKWLGILNNSEYYDDVKEGVYYFRFEYPQTDIDLLSEDVQSTLVSELNGNEKEQYEKVKSLYEDLAKNNQISYYGIINCEGLDSWINHYEALYQSVFRVKGQMWRTYLAHKLELPGEEDLKILKGLVVTGSLDDAYNESKEFIRKLYEFFPHVNKNYPNLKLMGVCFGHQILAHSLGGKASRMPNLKTPVFAAVEEIKINEKLKEKEYFKKTLEELNLQDIEKVYGVATHGDHVEKIPDDGEWFGTSNSTNVEIWGKGSNISPRGLIENHYIWDLCN